MTHNQIEHDISCPYCGEHITVLVDPSEAFQRYIEDCQVCCNPMNLSVSVTHPDDSIAVRAETDDT